MSFEITVGSADDVQRMARWANDEGWNPGNTDAHAFFAADPGGFLIGPLGRERLGDVSNVTFTNGAIAAPDGRVYIFYASSDTRLHVATTDLERLVDYVFNTPADPGRSADCVRQRVEFIRRGRAYLKD